MISVASAPAKVILFGEHFIVYGGKAILCAIDKRITVESELVDSATIKIESDLGTVTISKNESIKNVDSKFRPVFFIAQKILQQSNLGIRISIKSEIPSGVGLGSSSACCVAAARSISGLFKKTSKEEILKLALEAEKTVFENASGADTTSCTYGGIMEYTKNGTKNIDVIPNFYLVIANSKIIHSTSDVVLRVKQFKETHAEEFSLLCINEASLIEEAINSLNRNDLKKLGEKMLVNQTYLHKIGVSNESLDAMIDSAKSVSYGAKITGAGDGGCIVALVDDSNLRATLDALSKYECFSTKIDSIGVKEITP